MCTDPRFMLYVKDWKSHKGLPIPFHYFRQNYKDGSLVCWLHCEEYEWLYNNFPALRPFLILIPCRKCLGCLLDRKDDWATRCMLESEHYSSNYFVTLTYRDEDNAVNNGELVRRDFQLFMKRLRKWCAKTGRPSPRVYYRGEYGDRTFRPHFHAILFNLKFDDLVTLFYRSKRGKKLQHAAVGAVEYSTSEMLVNLWTHGNVIIAPVTLETIKYTANYLDKGKGRIAQTMPFNGYSNRPALGKQYFDEHYYDYFLHCGLHSKRFPARTVKYFNRKLKELHPLMYEIFIQRLAARAAVHTPWETLGISRFEYLARHEEILRQKCKVRKKEEYDLATVQQITNVCNRLSRGQPLLSSGVAEKTRLGVDGRKIFESTGAAVV